MKIQNGLLFALTLICFAALSAQSDCSCCSEYHSQFDFWEGKWMVYDTSGQKLGESMIRKVEDSCVIAEEWASAQSDYTGRSFSFFETADSTWNQLWLDNKGGLLRLKGSLKGKSLKMSSRPSLDEASGQLLSNQLTWTPLDNGEVSQRWDIIDLEGKIVNTVFYGIYRRSSD